MFISIKNRPDPNIDWENIRYNRNSEYIRPELGYRLCTKCQTIYPVNGYYFSRNKKSPDGYNYICKNCCHEYYINKKNKK